MKDQRILIVGPSWVGDMVMAQSLFNCLIKQNQNCHIDVIAPPWAVAVVRRMPDISTAIELPIGHGQFNLKQRYQIGKRLREQCYSRAIVLPNSWKSALIPFFAKIPCRTGYIGECRWGLLNDARQLDKKRLKRTVDQFVALADEQVITNKPVINPDIKIPQLQANPEQAQKLLQTFKVNQRNHPVMAICPGAEYGPAKQWPENHYASIARYYVSKGWKIWLFGSANDQPVCKKIKQLANVECTDFSGQTSLPDAIDLLALSTVVVSNDSGLMHVAAALSKPLVALYGSSDPQATPPLGTHSRTLSLTLPCSPCFQRECRYGHLNCLTQLKPDLVIKQIDNLCAF